MKILKTPYHAKRPNAICECFLGSVRREVKREKSKAAWTCFGFLSKFPVTEQFYLLESTFIYRGTTLFIVYNHLFRNNKVADGTAPLTGEKGGKA